MEVTAGQIAALIGGELTGNPDVTVHTPSKIEEGKPGSIAFLANPKYEHFLYTTDASVVLINRNQELKQEVSSTLIAVEDAYASFVLILKHFSAQLLPKAGVHELAYVHPSAEIGTGVYIGPHAYVGENVKIGQNCKIFPFSYLGINSQIGEDVILFSHVQVYDHCKIGDRVIIHSGTVIGSDGFGFAPDSSGQYHKIPQIGNVVIGSDVEIGANCAIDRATMGSTRIGNGTKIDNLVHLAHNVEIGEHTVIAAQVGVAGSTKIGDYCAFGGQSGVSGHIQIASRTKVNAQSGIAKTVKSEGESISGSPAFNWRDEVKAQIVFRKLPTLLNRIEELEEKIKDLEQKNV